MAFYGFEYFSGANVIVKMNEHACLEAAGISYSYHDSKRPIYGYSSVYFDAVAPGQKIVQGSLVINYVYDNYLFDCIKKGMQLPVPALGGEAQPLNTIDELVRDAYTTPNGLATTTSAVSSSTSSQPGFDGQPSEVFNSQTVNTELLEQEISALQQEFWAGGGSNEDIANFGRDMPATGTVYGDPLSLGGGVQISINFANRGEFLTLDSVNFVGRGSTIQIDENVIVEEYSFFARRIRGSLTTPY